MAESDAFLFNPQVERMSNIALLSGVRIDLDFFSGDSREGNF
jgi:hypothetical protein